jgi:signal transduction histidine kinase
MDVLYGRAQTWHSRTVELGGRRQIERTIMRGILGLRLVQLAPFVIVVTTSGMTLYTNPTVVVWVFALCVMWSIALFTVAFREGRVRRELVIVDVAIATASAAIVGSLCRPDAVVTWGNWTLGTAMGAAVCAVTYLPPLGAVLGTLTVVAGYGWGIAQAWPEPSILTSGLGNAFSILAFALVMWLVANQFRSAASSIEILADQIMEARRSESAQAARLGERRRQHRMLHDTVLSTLTMLSRGVLDSQDPQVQQRCAGDAAYLRSLITADRDDEATPLAERLSRLGRDFSTPNLDVTVQVDMLPDDLPDAVADSIWMAAREALNNVVKHAQTDRAWVTATGDPGGILTVAIVDQGVGFGSDGGPTLGLGIRGSITERLEEVGGRSRVESAPGEGTMVELTWPSP